MMILKNENMTNIKSIILKFSMEHFEKESQQKVRQPNF